MARKSLSMLLVLSILLSLLTGTVQAVGTAIDLEPYVREQYETLARSLDRVGADETALWAMVNHALYGRGEDLAFGNNNAMTAVMLNSEMYKETVIEALTAAIERMQTFCLDELYLKGSAGWYDYQMRHYLTDYDRNGLAHDGILYEPNFTGTLNDNDVAMILVVGSATSQISLQKVSVTEESVTYEVSFYLADGFDFDNTYEDMEELGYDVSLAEALTMVGKLLAIGLIDEYDWYVDASFEMTVPNTCDHQAANYSWTFDGENLVSVSDGMFTENLSFVLEKSESDEEDGVTFQLDQTVQLLHDKPWVMEFTTSGDNDILLSPTTGKDSRYPYLNKTMVKTLEIGNWYQYHHYMLGGIYTGGGNSRTSWEHSGLEFSNMYSGSVKTYRLENRVAEDGSNMVHLYVGSTYKGPLSAYYTSRWDGMYSYRRDDLSWMNGRDFFINYVDQENVKPGKMLQALSIWEDGSASDSSQVVYSHVVDPTCTEQGYTVHACTICGAEFASDFVEPTGHHYDNGISIAWTEGMTGALASGVCVDCGEAGEERFFVLTAQSAEDGSVTFQAERSAEQEDAITAISRENGFIQVTLPETDGLTLLAASYTDSGRMTEIRTVSPEETATLPLADRELRIYFISADTNAPALPVLVIQGTAE